MATASMSIPQVREYSWEGEFVRADEEQLKTESHLVCRDCEVRTRDLALPAHRAIPRRSGMAVLRRRPHGAVPSLPSSLGYVLSVMVSVQSLVGER